MEQRFGLDSLGNGFGCEFSWIVGQLGEKQFVVGKSVDHGLLLIFHGWLGQLEGFFGQVRLIERASCDGLNIGKLESSLDPDVAYLRVEAFVCIVFDTRG